MNFWTKQTMIVTLITTFWTFHSPTTELFELAKDLTKNLLHSRFEVFHFCDSMLQQRFLLEEEVSISKEEIESSLDRSYEFLKAFDQANKVSQIPLSKPKVEIGFTKAKDELFSHFCKEIVEHLNRQIRLSFRLEKNNTCVFSIKKFEQYGDQFFLTEVDNLGYRKIKHLYRNRLFMLTKVTFLRAITMFSAAFTSDCAYDNSTVILIGDVFCPYAKCLGKLCLHKRTFQSLGRRDCQCPQCASVGQVRNIPFEDQTNSSFLSLGQEVYIFEESPKPIQDVYGDVCCPGKYCRNREKCKPIGGYVTTPRSIYFCDKCGAQLFVHKAPFTLQEHVKTTKTDTTRFFFAKKR